MLLVYIAEVVVLIPLLIGLGNMFCGFLAIPGPNAVKFLVVGILFAGISLALNYVFDLYFDVWPMWDWWFALWQ